MSPVGLGLRRMRQPVRPVGEWANIMGHAQAIIVDRERGILMGGSDSRGDGKGGGAVGGIPNRS